MWILREGASLMGTTPPETQGPLTLPPPPPIHKQGPGLLGVLIGSSPAAQGVVVWAEVAAEW